MASSGECFQNRRVGLGAGTNCSLKQGSVQLLVSDELLPRNRRPKHRFRLQLPVANVAKPAFTNFCVCVEDSSSSYEKVKNLVFQVLHSSVSTSWRGIFEGPKTIIAVLNEATLLAFDDYTKERCIAAFLLSR